MMYLAMWKYNDFNINSIYASVILGLDIHMHGFNNAQMVIA